MRAYWLRLNPIFKTLRPSLIWEGPKNNYPEHKKSVYLSFDDGPTPKVTEWVLDLLKEEKIFATFFLIGKNIAENPEIYDRILAEGHQIGNHTENHLKGSEYSTKEYLKNIEQCQKRLNRPEHMLFRPPYGRIKAKQVRALIKQGYSIIMWSILSGDWDQNNSPEQCRDYVIKYSRDGSIIVFHDSIKAEKNLRHSLPEVIQVLKSKGFAFKKLF